MRLAISTTETLTDLKTDLIVANNNNMVNEFPSTACVGIDVGSGCGFGRVGRELQDLHTQFLIRLYSAEF